MIGRAGTTEESLYLVFNKHTIEPKIKNPLNERVFVSIRNRLTYFFTILKDLDFPSICTCTK